MACPIFFALVDGGAYVGRIEGIPDMEESFTGIRSTLSRFEIATEELLTKRALLSRRDWKFVLPQALLVPLFEQIIDTHHVLLAGEECLARYRTQYYDTPDLRFFHDHRRGRRLREKVRIRSYQDRCLLMLEVKAKLRDGKTHKSRRQLPWELPLEVSENRDFFLEHGVDVDLVPSVGNAFRRVTLLGRDVNERVTIDLGLRFDNRVVVGAAVTGDETFRHGLNGLAIVEIKSGSAERDSIARKAIRGLGIRPQSISKYCVGLMMLHPDVRANRFRPVLRMLSRMEERCQS